MTLQPRFIYFFGLALMLVVGTGCGGGNSKNPVSGRKNTMVIHLLSDPEGLNPVNSIGADANNIHNIIFDHLIVLDNSSLLLEPWLVESMPEVSEDKLQYTFKLREGITFSDGTPMTTKDVLFSFKAIMNPFVDSAPKRAELQNYVDCEAIDDRSFKFRLADSGPFNLSRLAIYFFVLPKHVYDPQNLTDSYSAAQATLADRAPDSVSTEVSDALKSFAEFFEDEKFQREADFVMGSGRYVFDSWTTGQSVRLIKNEKFWNKSNENPMASQNMDTIVYKTIPDIQTAFQALLSGEIDFSDKFEPEQYEKKMTGKNWDKYFLKKNVPYPYYEYIGWNTKIKGEPRKVFFADAKVRMAMSYLIDVEEIIRNVMNGTAEPITSMIYHGRPEYNKSLKPIAHDEEKAKDMLKEAGWTDSNSDGTLDKTIAGRPVEFKFNLYYRRGNDIRRRIARHIQDKFKKVGIQVEVVDLDWAVMLDRLKKHELDAWIGAWVYDSDEQDLFSLFHSSQMLDQGYNWTSYGNIAADSVMEAIVKEWDQEKRFDLHREIQRILYEDQPYTLLFANAARFGYNKRLKFENWFGQRPCYDPAQFELAKPSN